MPERAHYARPDLCPNVANHTYAPTGYLAWHEWAEKMAKTHTQRRCETCDFWTIWEHLSDKRDALPNGHRWATYGDLFPEDFRGNSNVCWFAYSTDYHNGPKCLDCGRTGCEHCDHEMLSESCPKAAPQPVVPADEAPSHIVQTEEAGR